jgi:hypothetical protein
MLKSTTTNLDMMHCRNHIWKSSCLRLNSLWATNPTFFSRLFFIHSSIWYVFSHLPTHLFYSNTGHVDARSKWIWQGFRYPRIQMGHQLFRIWHFNNGHRNELFPKLWTCSFSYEHYFTYSLLLNPLFIIMMQLHFPRVDSKKWVLVAVNPLYETINFFDPSSSTAKQNQEELMRNMVHFPPIF